MDLIILRHGKAGDRRDWEGDDRLRPLTEEGIVRTQEVLDRLRPAFRVDAIWTSPWTRARQTAEIAGRLWRRSPEDHAVLAGDAAMSEAVVGALAADAPERLMLVGHEPSLGELVGHLLGTPPLPLKKAGLAWLEGRARAGGMRLKALVPPGLVLDIGE